MTAALDVCLKTRKKKYEKSNAYGKNKYTN